MVSTRSVANGCWEICPCCQGPERVHPSEARRADHSAVGRQALCGTFALGEDRPAPSFKHGLGILVHELLSPLTSFCSDPARRGRELCKNGDRHGGEGGRVPSQRLLGRGVGVQSEGY